MAHYLYSELANLVQARLNCMNSNNQEWKLKHEEKLESLVEEFMPRGSGFDRGTRISLGDSHADKLIFHTYFHHMNDNGYYDGWTEHTVTITPSFIGGFNMRITGRNRNQIKDYMKDYFNECLKTDLEVYKSDEYAKR